MSKLIEIIFPIHCLKCSKYNHLICDNCMQSLFFEDVKFIDVPDSELNKLCIMGDYSNDILKQSIQLMKYKYVEKMAIRLGDNIGYKFLKYIKTNNIDPSKIMITSVPMHRRKYLERGFNQSDLLAQAISDRANCPLETKLLTKHRKTKSQMELNREERLVNVKDSVSLQVNKCLEGIDVIIIIDDIYTTGSTLSECSRVIKSQYDVEVWGLVLGKNLDK